jgi:hypothetical protein
LPLELNQAARKRNWSATMLRDKNCQPCIFNEISSSLVELGRTQGHLLGGEQTGNDVLVVHGVSGTVVLAS